MAKELLNADQLPAFIEWYRKYSHDQNMTMANLLNIIRRKLIRVSKGKLDNKTEYDKLMAEFLQDVSPKKSETFLGSLTDDFVASFESSKAEKPEVSDSIMWRLCVTHLPEGVDSEDERVKAILVEIQEIMNRTGRA